MNKDLKLNVGILNIDYIMLNNDNSFCFVFINPKTSLMQLFPAWANRTYDSGSTTAASLAMKAPLTLHFSRPGQSNPS